MAWCDAGLPSIALIRLSSLAEFYHLTAIAGDASAQRVVCLA